MKLPTSHFTKEQHQFRLEVREFLQEEMNKVHSKQNVILG